MHKKIDRNLEGRRLYSQLKVKKFADGERTIEGVATTPTIDRMNDIVDPMGAKIGGGIKLLWQHNHTQPIGEVRFGKPTKAGIPFSARLRKPKEDYPKSLVDRLEEAWVSVRDGLVEFVSIGFRTLAYEILETGGLRFTEWEMLELSLVTIPANADATITNAKSFDQKLLGATAQKAAPVKLITARVGASQKKAKLGDSDMPKNISEQISAWELQLEAKKEEREAIQQKALNEGRAKDETEREQFDDLTTEIKSIQQELQDLREIEGDYAQKSAKPVNNDSGSDSRQPAGANRVLGPNRNIPKGIAFARQVMCLAQSGGNSEMAALVAEREYPDDMRIAKSLRLVTRAPVAALNTGNSTQGGDDIAEAQTVQDDFVEFLRERTIVDRLGLRPAQFNTKISRMTTGQSGYWVGEGKPAPLTSGVFDTFTMGKTKVAAIAVMSKEQLRFSNINAEAAVRDDLIGALVARLDSTFIGADAAGTDTPAGILNGVTGVTASGPTADDVRDDMVGLYANFSAANISQSGVSYVTTENLMYALRRMRSSLGVSEFPEVASGTLDGRPLIASNHVSGGNLVGISGQDVFLADDGQVSAEMSDQASLEMLDGSLTQDGTTGTGADLVNLWQNGLMAIKVERFINWQKARPAAVQFITGATYQGAASA